MSHTQATGLLNMDEVRVDPACALRVPAGLAVRRAVLPFALVDDVIHVACIDVHDASALTALQRAINAPLQLEAAEPESLRRAIQRIFGDGKGAANVAPRGRSDVRAVGEADTKDATKLCDELMHAALVRQASDVHIDPGERNVLIRFRVDGALERFRQLPTAVHQGMISRFKVLAGMDIAEKRAPQDGRFSYRHGTSTPAVDVRVATLPTAYGERMTIRLLALETEFLTLERLGMSPRDLELFEEAIDKPHGMILLTGPTGSGKTTTLYAAMRRLLEQDEWNIVTVEDPIEYKIAGVAQVEVDSADKLSFGKALRSIVRHDPDILMIGEIRDRETADIAVKASLTGHLVFSTLHTNSAASVITRLSDLGVERYLTAATVRLAVAQRLVRRLCAHCRVERPLTSKEALALGLSDAADKAVYEPRGCRYCANRGYRGRLGLFELLPIDEELAREISRGAGEGELIAASRERGLSRLTTDALTKVLAGECSVKDALTACTAW